MKQYTFVDEVYKDESPLNTVNKIKDILQQYGIQTEEIWLTTSVPYCFALRVNVVGTTFGTNGKGLSKELALASGYGELMERLQLGYISGGMTQKDGNFNINEGQDCWRSAQQLQQEHGYLYEKIIDRLELFTGQRLSVDRLLLQYANSEGMVQAVPYYNLTKGEPVYFASAVRKRIYSSNGCAAGNSMEEAIVQGISEIVERHHQLRLVVEGLTMPDVPEEVLQKYETAYQIITYVRNQGYKVTIKDCSLGTKFPVLCACFINPKTGKYHTHFGAFPIFEIALERTLTESFQGRDIHNIAAYDTFLSSLEEARSPRNLANELGKGNGEKQLSFFIGQPQYPYNPNAGFTGTTNRELFLEALEFFKDLGHEVLIRDGACLGFPTYQIIVPGYSETFVDRLLDKWDALRYVDHVTKSLRDPRNAKLENIMGLFMGLSKISHLDQTVTGVHGFTACARLSTKMTREQDTGYMALTLAHIYYTLGKNKEALASLNNAMTVSEIGKQPYLICLKRYWTLKLSGTNDDYITSVLKMFHKDQTVDKLLSNIQAGKNPLDDYVLQCKEDCSEGCHLYSVCCKKQVNKLSAIINEKANQLSFEDFTQKLQALLA